MTVSRSAAITTIYMTRQPPVAMSSPQARVSATRETHHADADLDSSQVTDDRQDINPYDNYGKDVLVSCQNFKDDSSRSFRCDCSRLFTVVTLAKFFSSWNLGICVPLTNLGSTGYLPEHQKCLESLSLITDDSCYCSRDGQNPLDLSQFCHLRDLSWTGLQSKEDFDALRECLGVDAHHLKSLSLHLSDWEKADEFWFLDCSGIMEDGIRSNSFVASDVMGLQPGKLGLSSLSLQSPVSLTFIVYVSNLRTIHGFQFQWASQVEALELPGNIRPFGQHC
jgi:hypothetical protein